MDTVSVPRCHKYDFICSVYSAYLLPYTFSHSQVQNVDLKWDLIVVILLEDLPYLHIYHAASNTQSISLGQIFIITKVLLLQL